MYAVFCVILFRVTGNVITLIDTTSWATCHMRIFRSWLRKEYCLSGFTPVCLLSARLVSLPSKQNNNGVIKVVVLTASGLLPHVNLVASPLQTRWLALPLVLFHSPLDILPSAGIAQPPFLWTASVITLMCLSRRI